ncbi:Flagellar regulatory protein FleQ [Minicystis rosea]|nr:Flagellar regulatory protein FleQ [Minicystis rosea]
MLKDPPDPSKTEKLPDDGNGPPPSPQRVTLIIHHPEGDKHAPLIPDEPLVVGRSEPADLVVANPSLSRRHARFTLHNGRVVVEDLGSTNGLYFEGKRVARAELELGGEITLAHFPARIITFGGVSPALDSEATFRRRLHEEMSRARAFHRSFAVVAVRASHTLATRAPGGTWAVRLRQRVQDIDCVSLYSPDVALVLLPERDAGSALEVARTIVVAERDAPVFAGVAVHPQTSGTAGELVDMARDAAGRAGPEEPVIAASTSEWRESSVVGKQSPFRGVAMQAAYSIADRVAGVNIPVLLHGETGVGKEILANHIHEHGNRAAQRMGRVNCGAIPATLVESTLFGHERGAFTGAMQQRRGEFEAAHQGTLFLDEIGDMPLEAQKVLLRVLDTKRFSRVGSTQEVEVDVRVIAATHRDLKALIESGDFREDLYYRLSTVTIEIPPLRKRLDELEPFIEHFIDQFNKQHRRSVRAVSAEAKALLRAHAWPGNVRELRNVIERAVVLKVGDTILPSDLPDYIRESKSEEGDGGSAQDQLDRKERELILDALHKEDWNREKAAARIGYKLRTFSRRMSDLGIKKPKK